MDDIGYVKLVDILGSDLTVANAARVSFDKRSEQLTEKDKKLIHYLAKNSHMSPFRHAQMSFEIYAPLVVARQWWKHCIGSSFTENSPAWNESSRRYITENNEFYVPKQWRLQGDNIKQGSSNEVHSESIEFTEKLKSHIKKSEELYREAIERGIAIEQARFFLPAYCLYIRYYWTASLQAVFNFIKLRTHDSAQAEIRDYAKEVESHLKEKFPISWEVMNLYQK